MRQNFGTDWSFWPSLGRWAVSMAVLTSTDETARSWCAPVASRLPRDCKTSQSKRIIRMLAFCWTSISCFSLNLSSLIWLINLVRTRYILHLSPWQLQRYVPPFFCQASWLSWWTRAYSRTIKKELPSNEAKPIMIDVPWTSTVWLSAKFDWFTVIKWKLLALPLRNGCRLADLSLRVR